MYYTNFQVSGDGQPGKEKGEGTRFASAKDCHRNGRPACAQCHGPSYCNCKNMPIIKSSSCAEIRDKVRALVLFEQSVDRSAVASICATQLHEKAAKEKKGLREGIMNHQWNQ